MSKVYLNQATGLTVIENGKIKSISEDRMTMVVTADEYNRAENKNVSVDTTIVGTIPFDADYKVGFNVTAAGYKRGKGTIGAETILSGNDTYENQDLAIVTGFVKFTRMNEEKNQDGTVKLNREGKPKKPHYDVTITVNEDGKWVDHIIKVYEMPTEDGKKSNMDRVANLFRNFDAKENRIRATFVTTPGQRDSYPYTKKDGTEGMNHVCYHMGYKSMDVEFVDAKEKTQTAPVASKAPNVPTPQPMPTQYAPAQSGTGFDSVIERDDDELFS